MSRPLPPPRHHLAALGFALAFGLTGCDEEGKTAADCPVLELRDITPAKGGTSGTGAVDPSSDCLTAVGDAVSPPSVTTDGVSTAGASASGGTTTAGSGGTTGGTTEAGGGTGGASAGTGGT